ncbi:MAG: glyoxalase [Gordonia sp.]|uniref:VOC family protein n=1 Tax=Gordonia sp. (in: high G+C Gram-positive bacteria) TaxID=84139 RepID=UPI000C45749D|nr:VOC family protein [Gordonia sp. (in: high G+C Gram-positive bacteria)]MAU81866.1 glyoxalase [Gordonia sp. (in: high G+C Gram-positive bacteria)]
MSEYNRTEHGGSTPPDPFVALRAADTPGWTDPVAPDAEFTRRLRDRLERGATLPQGVLMSTATELNAATTHDDEPAVERPGALPYLTVPDGRAALDWYVEHLGARLRGEPIIMDDGRLGHAELEIGGGAIYLADEFGDMGLRAPQPGHVSVSLMLAVDDADAAVAAAERGGAAVTREPYEGYGHRTGTIIDPFGHRWMLTGPSAMGAGAADRIHTGDIVYMSLQTPDAARAAAFYGAVLGWDYDPHSRQVTNLGHRLGISDAGGYGSNTLFCVYAVDDFDTARAAIRAAGGRAADEVTEVGRDGAHVLDAVDDQGVAFSVHVPAPGATRTDQHPRGVGEMSYLTVQTPSSARYRAFYGAVLGWEFRAGRIDDGWEVDDVHPQIGIAGGADDQRAVPMWNVPDMDAAVGRVRAAGGRVITDPDAQAYGIMAYCSDDQGAEFYLGQLF